jgi:DNA polymerase-3 subunit epsilon
MSHTSFSFLAEYRRNAIIWAREVLADEGVIILDTETTGLDEQAEIVEIAIINIQGDPLLDTLVKPKGKIPIDATAIHGISNTDVATAPTWAEIDEQVRELIQTASRVIIYNASYDTRLMQQTRHLYDLPSFDIAAKHYECAMKRYAEFYGQWSNSRRSFKWQPLDGGHRALGDCLATLKVLKQMAKAETRT